MLAVCNNADWYAMMFDIHGLRYLRSEIAFVATDPPPPYHSWITLITPTAQTQQLQLIKQNMHHSRFEFKDSFDGLNFVDESLSELFSASWIYANDIQAADTSNWIQITSVNDLLLWEEAWKGGGSPSSQRQFPEAILKRSDVIIWGRKDSNRFDAGVIANTSVGCVGLSNCFGRNAYPAAATLCSELAQEVPVVGYERGDDLAIALSIGFEATGLLRVWTRKG